MKYWYWAHKVHTADYPNWLRNHTWIAFVKNVDERVRVGDYVVIGNQEVGVFAWGTVQAISEVNENGEKRIDVGRGNIQQSMISSEDITRMEFVSASILIPKQPFTFLTRQQVRELNSRILEPRLPHPAGDDFIVNASVRLDEDLHIEFKDVATVQISKEAYEYAVAYASGEGGRVLFGVDDDGVVVGVELDFGQRNDLRKRIEEKLFTIQPPLLAVDDYTIAFENVIDDNGNEIANTFVIDLEIKPTGTDHKTAGGKSYHKGFSGRRRV